MYAVTGEQEPTIRAKNHETGIESSIGFPPIARRDARVLILGSLPGRRSLQAAQYYAHPQNAFWSIMHELTGAGGGYEQRCRVLLDHGIALWDVLAGSVRPGSMDADIALETAQVNDFTGFFSEHRDIERVCFNGKKAAQMFQRFVVLEAMDNSMRFVTLPSTSPAYASMPLAEKLAIWRRAITQ
jgi:hypoxanthine-DNA glycosylase